MSSSHKNTHFGKQNRLKRSPGSQDIEVLKSANFQGFFLRTTTHIFYLCSIWRPNLPKKIIDLSSSHNFTQFKKKNQPKWSPRSEVMSILTSAVFQGFSRKNCDFLPKLIESIFHFFFMKFEGLKSSQGAQMTISSQNLKEILEAFKSQLYDTLYDTLHDKFHDLVDGLNNSLRISLDSMQERFLMADIIGD